jgi:toxin HigB-1
MLRCYLRRNGLHSRMALRSFRHRGLERLFERGDRSRIRPDQVAKVRRILNRLDAASSVADVDAPGFRLHPLKGDLSGYWAVSVSGNWRIVFRFTDGDALDVDLVDYH